MEISSISVWDRGLDNIAIILLRRDPPFGKNLIRSKGRNVVGSTHYKQRAVQ